MNRTIVLLLLIFFHILDIVTTYFGLKYFGLVENNIIYPFIGLWGISILKLLCIVIIILLKRVYGKDHERMYDVMIAGCTILMALAVASNVLNILMVALR